MTITLKGSHHIRAGGAANYTLEILDTRLLNQPYPPHFILPVRIIRTGSFRDELMNLPSDGVVDSQAPQEYNCRCLTQKGVNVGVDFICRMSD